MAVSKCSCSSVTVVNVRAGARDLADLTGDADRVMLIGITCGLSAPYVAGQVDYSMEKVANVDDASAPH